MVDRWLMVLTTKQASYIIVLGIVISVLQISSTLHQDSYHVRVKHNSKRRRRVANQTMRISLKQMCPINQFAFPRHSQCLFQFWYHIRDHSQHHFRFLYRFQSQDDCRVYRGHFQVNFRSFPLLHTTWWRWAWAVDLWSSRPASQQSVRSSIRSLHLQSYLQQDSTWSQCVQLQFRGRFGSWCL